MIGTKLAHYKITAHLGSGGMGDVYQATDLRLKRSVAIKLLPAEFASDSERLSRFRREAQVLASLNHPNIAHIYGLEESGDKRCIVMELVEGETLQARLKRGPIPVEETLQIAKQICEALETAHEKGVIHRDLKPGNVMLTDDGKVKVLDFGLAKAMESDTPDANLSNSPTLMGGASVPGVILGTAAYMSPEQARGRKVDKRTDIFAFGCVLFEMLTAKPAFNGEDVSDILGAVLKLDPAWSALPLETPGAVRKLLRRCLEKDPRRRLADASDARIEIEEAIEEALAAPEDGDSPDASRPSRRSWLKFSAAVALSFVAGLLIRSALTPAPAKPPVSRLSFSLPQKSEFTNTGRPVLAFSPDGTKIVYVADRQLYLRSLDKMVPEPIHGAQSPTDVQSPFFSPDGQWIGYYSAGNLVKIPTGGGAPATICATAASYGAEWTKNNEIVFADTNGISRVTADGGKPEVLIATKPGEGFFRPQLLEDGDHVLFTVIENRSQWDKGDVVVQSLSTGERKVLVHGGADGRYVPAGRLTYRIGSTVFAMTFDAKRFVADKPVAVLDAVRSDNRNTGTAQYTFSTTGSLAYLPTAATDLQTHIVDLDGNIESAIDLPLRNVRISPDGKQLLSLDFTTGDAWIYDMFGKTAPVRLTFDGGYYGFAWSPDGRSIVIAHTDDILLLKADGSGQPETLIKGDRRKFSIPGDPSWSPDGKTIFFRAGGTLWTYTMSSKAIQSVFPMTVAPQAGEISPDGRWIAYHSNDTPDVNVFVQPYPPTGAKRQVSTGGGHHPLWAPDGKRLFYVKGDQLVAVDVRAAGSSLIFGPPAPLNIQVTQTMNTDRGYDVMPDGKRFVVPLVAGGTNQVNIVLNWFQELQQRTSPH